MVPGGKGALNTTTWIKSAGTMVIGGIFLGVTVSSGIAFAHGAEKHGMAMIADHQMKKLHAMMPMFSLALADLESALEKGDTDAAQAHAEKILAAVPDLKKSKPHKNAKQHKTFVEHAASLDATVTSVVESLKKDDLAGAKIACKKVEEICAACHARFRD